LATERRTSMSSRALPGWRLTKTNQVLGLAVLCVGVLCLFYYEVIFLNRTFLPFGYPSEVMGGGPPWQFSGTFRANPYRLDAGGSAWQLEPWARTVAASYASLQLPLWNPHQFFGTPLAADAQPGAFDILRLPALLTVHAWGWDVYYLSQSALSLVLTYAFGRSVGFRPPAAFVAAVAYTFSGFMFIRGNLHYIEVFHLVPGILWGTERVVRGAYRGGISIVAAAVALTLFAGMPEAAMLTFLYGASYGAFRAVWDAVIRRDWRFAVQRNAVLALAWIAGIGIAAPLLVPEVEYLGLSFNIHPPERGLGLIALPLRALAYIGVPYINGLPAQPITSPGLAPVDDYSGAAVVLLAVAGVVSLTLPGRARAVTAFALASTVIWGAKLFGVPGFQAFGHLPLLVQTLIYIWGTPLLTLSLALLAGAGVHALTTGRVTLRACLLVGLIFAGYLALAVRLNWQTLQTAGLRHAAMTVGVAAGAGFAVWVCLGLGRTWPRGLAAVAACGVVTAELFFLSPRGVYSDRYDTLAKPPFVTWLQQQAAAGEPFRVFSNDGILYPDYAQAFGLDDPRAVDGLYPGRTWDFVHTFLSPTVSDRYVGGFGHPELPTNLFANKWLDLSNVRYILRPPDQSPADATLAQAIVAANYPPNDDHHVGQFTLGGQRREVLVERTPGEIAFRMRPDAAQPRLAFFMNLDPNATGSSVQFTLAIQQGGQRQTVFQQSLDARNPSDRQWVPGSVDLGPYVGQDVELMLSTQSLDGSRSAPGWGDLRPMPLADQGQFKQVYAGEVSIWENTRAVPRAFLVGDIQHASDSADAARRMQAAEFDPRTMAVVEGDAGAVANLPLLPGSVVAAGSARVTAYGQQHVNVAVDARRPALLVLTDSYYPGWTAKLDGAEVPILATDIAFRGVMVPAGSHQVTFGYFPTSFGVGLALAVAGLLLLAALIWRLPSQPRDRGAQGAPPV
jgi:hypothetical protein